MANTEEIKDGNYWSYATEPIPADAMLGIQWDDDCGGKFETKHGTMLNGKREAQLTLSSFAGGVCFGAMHYYARIEARADVGRPEETYGGHGGYLGKRCPINDRHIRVEAKRPIKRGEKDANGEPIGRAGELTYRFNTEKEAYETALKVFMARFGPGWCLVLQDYVNDYAELQGTVVAET